MLANLAVSRLIARLASISILKNNSLSGDLYSTDLMFAILLRAHQSVDLAS